MKRKIILSNAWDSAECPQFKGVVVADAVPGNWEDMVPRFREAGFCNYLEGK